MRYPKTAALTGGIASGKTTVALMFQELGAWVIDADIVAREVVEPGKPAWKEIVAQFGWGILLDNRQINRAKLAAIVFDQPEKRRTLEQIIHPRVITAINRQEQGIRATEKDRLIIVDVPLLIEAGMYKEYATVIVVYVSEATQLQRLMARDNLSEEIARKRISAQMLLTEKLKYATQVINNNGPLTHTRGQVEAVYEKIMNAE